MGQAGDPVAPQALGSDLRRSTLPQQITTLPHAAEGFLWAMGERGDLYRLNPYAAAGEQIEVQDRFWAEPQPHAFALGQTLALSGTPAPFAEHSAVIATAERVVVSGLCTRQRRTFTPAEGEHFLVNSRDEFQSVAVHGGAVFLLSRHAGQTQFCHFDLRTGEARRFAVALGTEPVCGPALVPDGDDLCLAVWNATSLWLYREGRLTPVALPEAVAIWTAPGDTNPHLPPGHSPAITGPGQLFLPAHQFGRPALLRLARGPAGWSATAVALLDEGTLGVTTAGVPLLSSTGKVLACPGTAFRTLVQDPQIATRFAAWAHEGLLLSFCQADYGSLKQWLEAYVEGTATPVSWDLPAGAEVHACAGFWTMGTALASLCVLGDRGLRTEFLSWCV